MDISADLTELGRTPVTVISSGCKSFLDIPRTLEYLETQGVLVGTFADGREGRVDFPAFWTRDSGIPSSAIIKDEKQAAAIICMSFTMFINYQLHCEWSLHSLSTRAPFSHLCNTSLFRSVMGLLLRKASSFKDSKACARFE